MSLFIMFLCSATCGMVWSMIYVLLFADGREPRRRNRTVTIAAPRVIDRIWSDDKQVWTDLDIQPPGG